jgi:hypothetical protein
MTNATRITLDGIEAWLKDMNFNTTRVPADPQVNWNIEVEPAPGAYRLNVFHPKATPRCVVVAGNVLLTDAHRNAFKDLDDDEKTEFSRELIRTLDRDSTEYRVMDVRTELDFPTGFQVTATRFDDALSLDALYHTVSSVFKTMLAATGCVNRYLNPRGAGGAGHFEFKRMGGLQ